MDTFLGRPERLDLILDGDDTLWENNVYFERAIEDFIAYLDHSSLSPAEVRAVLDEIEHANSRAHGYGSAVFGRSLRECYEHLAERPLGDDDLRTIMGFAERILRPELDLIAGVEETLAVLATRHRLTLYTKGHAEEQRLKIERSGLESYFDRAVVTPEKDVEAYRRLIAELDADPATTWMVGNSPRSDVNPALAAGLNAVFVPHDQTWRLEHEEMATGPGRLLVLERFAQLTDHF
jgi:putative hydrolase of the HAD superfamily